MPRPGPAEYIDDPILEWGFEATMRGAFCLRVLVQSIEQGTDELPIDPHAWENTMAAVEWMISQHLAGALYTEPRCQFAASWGHLATDFCRVMGPPRCSMMGPPARGA